MPSVFVVYRLVLAQIKAFEVRGGWWSAPCLEWSSIVGKRQYESAFGMRCGCLVVCLVSIVITTAGKVSGLNGSII